MVGVITKRDILAHPVVTIRYFGWGVFFRALFSGHDSTFLSLVNRQERLTAHVPALLQRCISVELRAKRLYIALARGLDGLDSAASFFGALADQEQEHADLLEVCQAAARRGGWKVNQFNPWDAYLPRLEAQMQAAEEAIYEVNSVEDAVKLALQIEASEINHVFEMVIAASDAVFVKKLRPFRKAMEMHMSYVAVAIPFLAPQFMSASRELQKRFRSRE